MTCQECELFLAQNEISGAVEEHLRGCPECRALYEDLRANALALESLRNEELPRVAVKTPRRRRVYPWVAAAAAAAMFLLIFFVPRNPPPVRPAVSRVVNEPAPPLKIKMLTPDPDVVIYWLIEN
jgi:anti-sigma factor RsiW